MAAPGEHWAAESGGGALLHRRFQAVEVHWNRTEHGQGRYQDVGEQWWDIYNDETLDYRNYVVSGDDEAVALQPFLGALSGAGVVHPFSAPSAA
ncbi:hypothetical protein SLA2020_151150 [Shorea laevis]